LDNELAGKRITLEAIPAFSQASSLLRTYTWLAASSPTKTAANCGRTPVLENNASTPWAVSARNVLAIAFPSRILALMLEFFRTNAHEPKAKNKPLCYNLRIGNA
jgi:hypothetical protein